MATLLQCTLPGAPSHLLRRRDRPDRRQRSGQPRRVPVGSGSLGRGAPRYVRSLLRLRGAEPALRHGSTIAIAAAGPAFAFERRLDGRAPGRGREPGTDAGRPGRDRSRACDRRTARAGRARRRRRRAPSRCGSRDRRRSTPGRPGSSSRRGPAGSSVSRTGERLLSTTAPRPILAACGRPSHRPGARARRTSRPGPGCRGQDPAGARGARSGAGTGRDPRRRRRRAPRSTAHRPRRPRHARRLERTGALRRARRLGRRASSPAGRRSAARRPIRSAQARRLLRPGGRLLVGPRLRTRRRRDLRGELPEHGPWSRRDGPFLASGFKVRVVHCWWTFESIEAARAFLADGVRGRRAASSAAALTRPRLSYNVADLPPHVRGGQA